MRHRGKARPRGKRENTVKTLPESPDHALNNEGEESLSDVSDFSESLTHSIEMTASPSPADDPAGFPVGPEASEPYYAKTKPAPAGDDGGDDRNELRLPASFVGRTPRRIRRKDGRKMMSRSISMLDSLSLASMASRSSPRSSPMASPRAGSGAPDWKAAPAVVDLIEDEEVQQQQQQRQQQQRQQQSDHENENENDGKVKFKSAKRGPLRRGVGRGRGMKQGGGGGGTTASGKDSMTMTDVDTDAFFSAGSENNGGVTSVGAPPPGLVFDAAMLKHFCNSDWTHPESPNRIHSIMATLEYRGLVDRYTSIPVREITASEVDSVHKPGHYQNIINTGTMSKKARKKFNTRFNSVFINADSAKAASLAAGGLVELVKAVVTGKASNGLAVIRPPGHHAEAHAAMGFCLFNNVAIAARVATQALLAEVSLDLPAPLSRVLILDWDIHHGNGIQNAFANDPAVVYVSLHRFDDGTFYPGSPANPYVAASSAATGACPGSGANFNIGWNYNELSGAVKAGSTPDPERGDNDPPLVPQTILDGSQIGDGDYLFAFSQIVLPLIESFGPELVLVSAGFDAAAGDPLGGAGVTPLAYATMTQALMDAVPGRVILALEGGYSLKAISDSAAACAAVLSGMSPLEALSPSLAGLRAVRDAVAAHEPTPDGVYRQCRNPDKNPAASSVKATSGRVVPSFKVPGGGSGSASGGGRGSASGGGRFGTGAHSASASSWSGVGSGGHGGRRQKKKKKKKGGGSRGALSSSWGGGGNGSASASQSSGGAGSAARRSRSDHTVDSCQCQPWLPSTTLKRLDDLLAERTRKLGQFSLLNQEQARDGQRKRA